MPIDKVKFPNGETEDIRDSRISGVDSAPTSGSANLVTSGGVKGALDGKMDIGGIVSDFNTEINPGNYAIDSQVSANRPAINYGQALVLRANTDTVAQLAFNYTSESAFFRGGSQWGDNWNSWREFAFKDDLSTALSGYLPLTGGTMTNTNLVTNLNADLLDGLHSDGFKRIKKNSKIISDTAGWYRILDCTGYPASFLITFSGVWYNQEPAPVTFLVSHAYRHTAISQIGRCANVGWITALRAVHHDTYEFYIDVYFSVQEGQLNPLDFEITPLDDCYDKLTLVDYELQSGDGRDAICYTSTDSVADYATNAATATKLYTARSIWGQSFDGTGDVSGLLTLSYASSARATGIEVTSSDNGEASIGFTSTNRTVFGRYNNRGFIWGSVAGEVMTFLDNGNVGIGTSSPSHTLHVSGDAVVTDGFKGETLFIQSSYTDPAVGVSCAIKASGNVAVGGDIIASGSGNIKGESLTTTLQTSEPSGGMLPNREYQLGTLSGNTTFTLAAGTSGVTNHYFWSFETGSTAPTITWPSGITSWYGGSAPTINASKHYEVSVLNGVAVVMEV